MPAVIYIKTIVTQAFYVNYLNTHVTNLHQCVGKFSQWNQFINIDKTSYMFKFRTMSDMFLIHTAIPQ